MTSKHVLHPSPTNYRLNRSIAALQAAYQVLTIFKTSHGVHPAEPDKLSVAMDTALRKVQRAKAICENEIKKKQAREEKGKAEC